MNTLPRLLLAALLCTLLAACGGGDDEDEQPAGPTRGPVDCVATPDICR